MKTWEYYKKEYAAKSEENEYDIERIETITEVVSRLVYARKEKGLSQEKLAKICGLKQSAIARLENLKAIPQFETLVKIMQPLGLKLKLVENI
jgi:ribosome-binding protein aMBF1 (putative translation factor)